MSLLPGPDKGPCECGTGCELWGTLGRTDSRGRRHVRACGCAVCMGRRNKRKGQRKQAKAATMLGVPRSAIRPGHEEFYGGALRMEVKAGKQVESLWARFHAAEAQSTTAKSIGDHRPFVFVAMPEGTSDGIVACRLSQLPDVAVAVLENLGGGAA